MTSSDPFIDKLLKEYSSLTYNYDTNDYDPQSDIWHHDSYALELPSSKILSTKGQTSFDIAKEILRTYKFPNPKRVVGYFDDASPFENRTMVLRASFLWVKVYFGVRIVEIIDQRVGEDKNHQVWGYSYRTLKGHWEIGEITFLLTHDVDTKDVKAEIKSYSRPDKISNLVYRIGFKIFGRFLQRQFARESLQRLRSLTRAELEK